MREKQKFNWLESHRVQIAFEKNQERSRAAKW